MEFVAFWNSNLFVVMLYGSCKSREIHWARYLQHCGFILDGTSRKVKTPKKEDKNISNQSERCIQILACGVYNDHAYPGQRITAKVEKAGGRLGQSVRCYWIVSSTLCSSVVVLKYCWWWLVGACVKGATEPNSTTN